MKLADIELPQGTVSQEVIDWMDNVRLVLNNGRYQQRVIDSIPTWSTHSGETLLYQSDTVRRQYAYINDQWCYFGFVDSDGTILVDGEIEIGSYLKANDTDGLWLGHADWASAPFRVNLVGALWATSANITGSVVASAGNIGGWDISAGAMTAGAGDTTVGMRPATYPFYSGASTPSVAPFRVDVNGNLVAESGFIGGWAITTDGLYTGSGGTRVKIDDGPYPFSAGSEDVGNAPFWVSRTGQVKCSNIIISGLAEGSDVSGIYISADSISANSMNVTELSAISANMGTVTAGTITAAIVQTSADPALSRVRMDSNGLWGYDSVLGQTFKIPTDGSSPIFASGQIQNATIVNTTIYDTDFYSASELPWIQLTSAGLRYVETLATGKYGSGVQYGDGTLYGTGYTATIFNSAKPLFNVEAERTLSDIHLYNRSSHSSGASTVGDLEVVSGNLYVCTTAGTPGTFSKFITGIVADGDVELFADADVGDAVDGNKLIVHRKAEEGDEEIGMFVTNSKQGYFYTTCDVLKFWNNSDGGGQTLTFETNATQRFMFFYNNWGLFSDTDKTQALIGVHDGVGNQLLLTNYSHYSREHDHAVQTNPTFYIHSDLNPNTSNNQWGSFHHNQEDFVITTGANVGTGDGATTDENAIVFAPRGTEVARAATAGIQMTASLFPKQTDDDDMDATNGTEGEIVYNLDDNTFYGCTATGTPAVWSAFQSLKGWASITVTTGTPTLNDSYNVSGIADTAVGEVTITWDVDFGSVNYAPVASALDAATGAITYIKTIAVGSVIVKNLAANGGIGAGDPDGYYCMAAGDR